MPARSPSCGANTRAISPASISRSPAFPSIRRLRTGPARASGRRRSARLPPKMPGGRSGRGCSIPSIRSPSSTMATASSTGAARRTAPESHRERMPPRSSRRGAEMVTFGGDHYITYPLLKAHAKMHGPLALVHFDAHRDVEPDDGGRIDHGTMFNYAVRDGRDRSEEIRSRSASAPPLPASARWASRILYADRVHAMSADEVAREIIRVSGRDRRPISPSISTASILRRRRAPARRFRAASPIIRRRRSSAS